LRRYLFLVGVGSSIILTYFVWFYSGRSQKGRNFLCGISASFLSMDFPVDFFTLA
jgi:hypothetical protein